MVIYIFNTIMVTYRGNQGLMTGKEQVMSLDFHDYVPGKNQTINRHGTASRSAQWREEKGASLHRQKPGPVRAKGNDSRGARAVNTVRRQIRRTCPYLRKPVPDIESQTFQEYHEKGHVFSAHYDYRDMSVKVR